MNTKAMIAGAMLALSLAVDAGEAPDAVKQQLGVLLDATRDNDLDQFESVCDDTMKAAMTAELLQQVSTQVAGLMKQGYAREYFGVVDRLQVKTYYWKLHFEGGKVPELLVEMSVADGKVAGFFLR